MEQTIIYDLPAPPEAEDVTIFADGTGYIAAPIDGCTQTYYLEIEDETGQLTTNVPSYYDLDVVTGELTFTSTPYQIVDDRLVIAIHSTDGVVDRLGEDYNYPFIQTTNVINV